MAHLAPENMKNITIAIPDFILEYLEQMKQQGKIPSRSEGIRMAVRFFFQKEIPYVYAIGFKQVKN